MIHLILERSVFTEKNTLGKLYNFKNGSKIYICDTLEDKYRDLSKEQKVYGKTAIPTGTFRIKNLWSGSYKRNMPVLQGVPYFSNIMIHTGNTEDDSLGCILVGTVNGSKIISGTSWPAFNKLWSLVRFEKEYEIEIINK